MPDVDDRWYRTVTDPGGKPRKVPTPRHGKGKRWDARWRDDTGKPRHKAFERKLDAERFLTGLRADLARGLYIDPSAGKVTLRSYATSWLDSQAAEATTREQMELRFRLHIFPVLGDVPLASLAQRPSLVQSWARGLQPQLAANYVRTLFANLSAVLTAAVDDNLIPRNPCRAGSVHPPRAEQPRVRPWSISTAAAVRAALPGRYRALADCGAGLGMRQGEVFGLSPDDVDWLRGVVHIRRQVRIVGAKLVFAPPKGGRERDVPLPESVKLRLAAHASAFPPAAVTLPWKAPGGRDETVRLMFTSRERAALNRNYVNAHVWKAALAAAGVPQTRENGFHALRHHFASVLLHDGVDIRALAEYLGHADPGFTLRVYVHLMPDAEDRMRAAVDRAMAAAGGRRQAG